MLAARELAKQGDWFGGSHSDTLEAVNRIHINEIQAAGGDPFIGSRLGSLLQSLGFLEIAATPDFSPALSSVEVLGALFMRRLQEEEFIQRVANRGRHSAAELRAMVPAVESWMQDGTSVVGMSECNVLARKPQ